MADGAYIDRDGFNLPEYPATLEAMQQSLRDIFGADLYLEPDSQEGQLAAIIALAQQDTYALAAAVYNAFSPQTAQGAGLSRMVIINGIRRQAAGVSAAPVRLTGVAGTIIKAGQLEDDAGCKWDLPAEVVIPAAGEITVTATAQEARDIHAAAGEINIIATPCRGWQSAVNTVAATPGRAVETDAACGSGRRSPRLCPASRCLRARWGPWPRLKVSRAGAATKTTPMWRTTTGCRRTAFAWWWKAGTPSP